MSMRLGMCGWELGCAKWGWKGWAGEQHAAACVEGSEHTAGGQGTQMAAGACEVGAWGLGWQQNTSRDGTGGLQGQPAHR